MMASVEAYLRRWRRQLQRWVADACVSEGLRAVAYGGCGFLLAAASLRNVCLPLAMGGICALTGYQAMAMCLGSVLGYRFFWGAAGIQGICWALGGGLLALVLGNRLQTREQPLLLPSGAAFLTAAVGLSFRLLWEDETPTEVYLLRIALAAGSTLLFVQVVQRRSAIADWLGWGAAVLALAQVMPLPYVNLGCIVGGALAMWGAFPAAALAGLGLDLAQVTPLPMGAALCMAYFSRLLPLREKWVRWASPGICCGIAMVISGVWDVSPLPGLLLGGMLGSALPPQPELRHRRGETGLAQVRLELTAGVLERTGKLLQETKELPIDEDALLRKVVDRACGGCSLRNSCTKGEKLTVEYLRKPLEFYCRKSGRLQPELRRGREQLRLLRADRDRRREYRTALVQQYRFLSDYLHHLADQLPRRGSRRRMDFRVEVSARSSGKERANGDKCMAFLGAGCKYYVLLCDGMGTGCGAARAGSTAGQLLRQMLTAGFPAAYAFRSVNSILALRGEAGAVTLDLAEIRLDNGKAVLYKWGAAPSWLLKGNRAEKIGTATPPPGLSVTEARETVSRLSLRRGEALVLLSDGIEGEGALGRAGLTPEAPPGELAARILERGCGKGEDDATVAVIRLFPASLST